jgi:hypothetical protein
MIRHLLLAPLKGEVSLASAWWLYGLAVNAVGLLVVAAARAVTGATYLLPAIVALPVCIYWAVGVWQCAYNCKSRTLGTYIRACVAASFLAIVAFGVAALHGQ